MIGIYPGRPITSQDESEFIRDGVLALGGSDARALANFPIMAAFSNKKPGITKYLQLQDGFWTLIPTSRLGGSALCRQQLRKPKLWTGVNYRTSSVKLQKHLGDSYTGIRDTISVSIHF
jgi:hypothetical protein